MEKAKDNLKAQLSLLPSQERAEIAHFLIHTLDDGADDYPETGWDEELTRRMQEISSGTASGEPAERVFEELRKKYS